MDLGVRAASPIGEFENEASLVHLAGVVGRVEDFPAPLSCHVAVWYWAKQQASRESSTFPPETLATAFRIAAMREGPQNAMLRVRRSGHWDFNLMGGALPPIGTVLLWEQSPTHSAIVTEHGITGYNQVCVFASNVTSRGYSHGQPRHILHGFRICVTIDEKDIIEAAAELL